MAGLQVPARKAKPMKIGLLSDNHGHMDDAIVKALEGCDEIWHAGDLGSHEVADELEALAPFRAVWGNIDEPGLRRRFPENLEFECEGVRVLLTHIGGYPGRYDKRVKRRLQEAPPDLFLCGHSHILKVMRDEKLHLWHFNPGACGHEGFHQVRTLLRFTVKSGEVGDLQVVELGPRGRRAGAPGPQRTPAPRRARGA